MSTAVQVQRTKVMIDHARLRVLQDRYCELEARKIGMIDRDEIRRAQREIADEIARVLTAPLHRS